MHPGSIDPRTCVRALEACRCSYMLIRRRFATAGEAAWSSRSCSPSTSRVAYLDPDNLRRLAGMDELKPGARAEARGSLFHAALPEAGPGRQPSFSEGHLLHVGVYKPRVSAAWDPPRRRSFHRTGGGGHLRTECLYDPAGRGCSSTRKWVGRRQRFCSRGRPLRQVRLQRQPRQTSTSGPIRRATPDGLRHRTAPERPAPASTTSTPFDPKAPRRAHDPVRPHEPDGGSRGASRKLAREYAGLVVCWKKGRRCSDRSPDYVLQRRHRRAADPAPAAPAPTRGGRLAVARGPWPLAVSSAAEADAYERWRRGGARPQPAGLNCLRRRQGVCATARARGVGETSSGACPGPDQADPRPRVRSKKSGMWSD